MEQGLQPQMVRPRLYIASVRTELSKDLLEQSGITHVLQVCAKQAGHAQVAVSCKHLTLSRVSLDVSLNYGEVYFCLAWPHICSVLLQVGVELQPSHPNTFVYLQLPIYDMPEQDIVASFPAAFDFIEQAINKGKQL